MVNVSEYPSQRNPRPVKNKKPTPPAWGSLFQQRIQLVVLHIESQAGALVVQQSADAADGFPRYSRDGHTVHDIGILGGNTQGGT